MISVDQKVDEEIMQGARQNLCTLEKIFALSQNMQGDEALSDLTSDQHMAIVLRHLNIESRSVHPPYDIFSGTDALMEEFKSTIGDELLLKNLCDAVEKCTDLIFGSLPTLVNSTEQLPFSIEQMLACLTWYIESIERAVGARKSDVDMDAEEQKVLSIQENHLHQIDAIVAKYAQLYGIFDIIHCPIPGAHHLLGLVYNLGLFLQPPEAEKLLELTR